jgi:hypothetical protein
MGFICQFLLSLLSKIWNRKIEDIIQNILQTFKINKQIQFLKPTPAPNCHGMKSQRRVKLKEHVPFLKLDEGERISSGSSRIYSR